MRCALLLGLVAASLGPVFATGGIEGTVSANGLNYIVKQLIPVVVNELDQLTIPDQAGDVRVFGCLVLAPGFPARVTQRTRCLTLSRYQHVYEWECMCG
jgi:hypothetical protein